MLNCLVKKLVSTGDDIVVRNIKLEGNNEAIHLKIDNLDLCVSSTRNSTDIYWIFPNGSIGSYVPLISREKLSIESSISLIQKTVQDMLRG